MDMDKKLVLGSGFIFVYFFAYLLLSIPIKGEGNHRKKQQSQDKKKDFSYRIKEHNGSPTLFINGKPSFYGTWWTAAPEADNWVRADFVG